MQSMKRVAITLTNFIGKILALESAVLIVVGLVWHWTNWHTTDSYGAALSTIGGTIIGLGLFALVTRGGSDDMKLSEAEMEMRSWDHKGQRRFISPYSESIRVWVWLISLGIATVVMGIIFNIFIP
ncbi:MAG TPA: hypothetical protein VK249_12880 [Anaerolineales bacterium]|nr:hypothetical protein [Anaerolineales bacterium]